MKKIESKAHGWTEEDGNFTERSYRKCEVELTPERIASITESRKLSGWTRIQ